MNAPSLVPVAPERLLESYSQWDALVVVAPAPIGRHVQALGPEVRAAVEAAVAVDDALAQGPRPAVVLAAAGAPGGRLVLAPTSSLTSDVDDVRMIGEAVTSAVARAVDAGARKPLVFVAYPDEPKFAHGRAVAALGALASTWSPLEAREAGKAPPRASTIGVVGLSAEQAKQLEAVERGRALCRDITGTEPERMAPGRIVALCEEAFAGTGVRVSVERDVARYPLLAAVARASQVVERHRPAVLRLEYTPSGPVTRTMILAGKGVTYDTGGADLKTNGHMAGMSRDKGGAGAVAGLVLAAAAVGLPGVRILGLLGLVRNSIGEESYVSDEIITARSGVRVRIGNTDAEGRLVLADLLAAGREIAASAQDPILVSIATLTGHVHRAFGPYVGAIGNGPARAGGHVERLDRIGEAWGEPFERTRPRREDYHAVRARGSTEDVVSANNLASVDTSRGHQLPYAFLDVAAGLKNGTLPFVHLDIAGVAVNPPDWQFGKPTGSPIATLLAYLGEP